MDTLEVTEGLSMVLESLLTIPALSSQKPFGSRSGWEESISSIEFKIETLSEIPQQPSAGHHYARTALGHPLKLP